MSQTRREAGLVVGQHPGVGPDGAVLTRVTGPAGEPDEHQQESGQAQHRPGRGAHPGAQHPEDDADEEQGRDVPVAGRSGGGVHPSFVRRSDAARGRIAEVVASGQDDRVKLTVRDPMSAWASVAVTSSPSGTGPLPVTRASMAGS